MATRLGLWNAALVECAETPLSDTGEPGKAGATLATVYNDVLAECLARGSWNFATKTIEAANDTGITPEFGYSKVFAKPSDWLRTWAVSEDENFSVPLTTFYDDVNYWSANSSPIYVRYTSNDTGFGLNLTGWPIAFTRYVVLELAHRICGRVTQGESQKDRIETDRNRARSMALNQDSMNEAQPKWAPPGSWTLSRGGRGSRDRGSRSNLTG